MKKMFLENVMLINSSGSNISNINGDITINVIRYYLKIKFKGDKGFSNIWLYINIPQLSIYFTTHVINKTVGKPIKSEKVKELLTCLLYEPKTTKTVFEENYLKPFKESPSFLSYKWKQNQYKILMFNLKVFIKQQNGIILEDYNKDLNSQENTKANEIESKDNNAAVKSEETKNEIPDEIPDDVLKKNIEIEFKQTVAPNAFNKLKNITKKLLEEVKKSGPLKKIDKENIKEDLKDLFTKFFDKRKEFIIVLKKLKILDQSFDENNEENISQISEKNFSFYKELKNVDLFLENYLRKY